MKTTPPAVTIEPPRFGAPRGSQIGKGAVSRVVPSVDSHRILPETRSTAVSVPHGGGLQGAPSGESSGIRATA